MTDAAAPGRRRVLHVVSSMSVGGIQTYVLNVLRHYDRARWQMDVCYTGAAAGCHREAIAALDSALIPCRYSRALGPFVIRLARLLRAGRYDAVCDFTGDFAAASMVAGRLAGVATRIAFYRSSGIQFRPTPVNRFAARLLHRMVLANATAVLSNSRGNLDAVFSREEIAQHRCHVVYNGVDVHRFRPPTAEKRRAARRALHLPLDTPIVGHVGSFTPPKAQDVIVEAFARLRRTRPALHLLLVGNGPLQRRVRESAHALGLDGAVTFAGIRHDIPRALATLNVFAMPSRFEGFPNALIEAQAMGIPVVASDRPEMREALAPENLCGLVPVDDAIALEARLRTILDDDVLAARMGQAGTSFVRRHLTMRRSVRTFCSHLDAPVRRLADGAGRAADRRQLRVPGTRERALQEAP